MRGLTLTGVSRILCLGAHADDIEIGCGGTILALLHERSDLTVHWVVLSADGSRAIEAQGSAQRFLTGAESSVVVIRAFRDSYFPCIAAEVKGFFEELKLLVKPDVIFTHYGGDLHQDHRVVSELTWNTFRDHVILEYEVPKYDGGLGSPNLFVPLDLDHVQRKVQLLQECFPSQRGKQWFDAEMFEGLMRLRGMESNAPSKYAEAYYVRKLSAAVGSR